MGLYLQSGSRGWVDICSEGRHQAVTGLRLAGLQDTGAVVGAHGWAGEGRVAPVSPWCGTQS